MVHCGYKVTITVGQGAPAGSSCRFVSGRRPLPREEGHQPVRGAVQSKRWHRRGEEADALDSGRGPSPNLPKRCGRVGDAADQRAQVQRRQLHHLHTVKSAAPVLHVVSPSFAVARTATCHSPRSDGIGAGDDDLVGAPRGVRARGLADGRLLAGHLLGRRPLLRQRRRRRPGQHPHTLDTRGRRDVRGEGQRAVAIPDGRGTADRAAAAGAGARTQLPHELGPFTPGRRRFQ